MTRPIFAFPLTLAGLTLVGAGCAAAHGAPATLPDVRVFLAQNRCADGALAVAEPRCVGAAPQRARDAMRMRRRDWPAPDGYQIGDSYESDDGAYFVTVFSYAPFEAFIPEHGDGGELYVTDGTTVRIAATEDGGQMGVVQGFYGQGCGGTGWVLFRNDAPTGRWAELVAHLKGEPLGSACSARSSAYTRYRLETVALPFIIQGAPRTLTLPTVISEHFNAASLQRSSAMERSFMVQGVGRAIWEAWTKGPPAGRNLADRCPATAWSVAPAPGWTLSDCRVSTNLVAADGAMSGDGYGWPRPGLTLP